MGSITRALELFEESLLLAPTKDKVPLQHEAACVTVNELHLYSPVNHSKLFHYRPHSQHLWVDSMYSCFFFSILTEKWGSELWPMMLWHVYRENQGLNHRNGAQRSGATVTVSVTEPICDNIYQQPASCSHLWWRQQRRSPWKQVVLRVAPSYDSVNITDQNCSWK